jgi:hypothetical protein
MPVADSDALGTALLHGRRALPYRNLPSYTEEGRIAGTLEG